MPELWERQRGDRQQGVKGESSRAYHCFEHYRDMGPARSLLKAYSEHMARCVGRQDSVKRASGSWHYWSATWKWEERAAAYDRHLDLLRRVQVEESEKAEAEKWAQERREIRKRELAMAGALIKRAEEMLSFPLTTVTEDTVIEGGKAIHRKIVEPAKWTFSTAARLIDLADKLMRLAAEMETEHQKIDIAMVRAEARKVAEEYGVPEEEVLAQAEEIARDFINRRLGGTL